MFQNNTYDTTIFWLFQVLLNPHTSQLCNVLRKLWNCNNIFLKNKIYLCFIENSHTLSLLSSNVNLINDQYLLFLTALDIRFKEWNYFFKLKPIIFPISRLKRWYNSQYPNLLGLAGELLEMVFAQLLWRFAPGIRFMHKLHCNIWSLNCQILD